MTASPSAVRRSGFGDRRYRFAAGAVSVALALPILTLALIATGDGATGWRPLLGGVVARSGATTLLLLLGVGCLTAAIGCLAAWATTSFRFPGRSLATVALVLPLAVPPYIAAYSFMEFLHFSGPVQGAVRALFGFRSSREYWFPEIRSLPGAILILSLTLYPYVFLTVRAMLLARGDTLREAAAILGATERQVLLKVLLPLARPAIATGVALALMEAINDIGAVEALGVRTVTFAVYSTWLNGNDLPGATRIALAALLFVFALIAIERFGRRGQDYALVGGSERQVSRPRELHGAKAGAMLAACLLPAVGGFAIPCLVLADYASRRLDQAADPQLWRAALHTAGVASAAGLVAVVTGLLGAFALRFARSGALKLAIRAGALGYAVPGTVLGIGVLVALAAFDNALDAAMRRHFGLSTGLLLSGSGAAIVFACSCRFNAMSVGAIENGFAALSRQLDMAAQSLGSTASRLLAAIHLPMLLPALLTAFLLVFVETAKELSATILLRPFDFETLATFVYANASRAAFEDGALAALLIVAIGMLPVALLRRSLDRETRRPFRHRQPERPSARA